MVTAAEQRSIANAERAVNTLAKVRPSSSGEAKFGPFTVSYEINDRQARVVGTVKVGPLKAKLISGKLTRKKNCIEGDASAGVLKASLKICADFDNLTLTAKGKVCHKTISGFPIPKVKWKCDDYSKRIG